MSTANFEQVLQQLQPSYFKWKEMLETGPKIRARIHRVNLRWRVRIEENWDDEEDQSLYHSADYSNLDKRCEWTAGQLSTWKSATRLSHQEWKFTRKKEADKFITLYNLIWAE